MNIVGRRYWFFLISGLLILASIVALAVFGLKPGVEFTSGSLMTVRFEQSLSQTDLKNEVAKLGYPGALIQTTGQGDFLIRLPELNNVQKNALTDGLTATFGALKLGEFDTVGAQVAAETTRNTAIAIVVTAVGILLYLSWAFRKMPNPFHFGICAVIALLHDIVVVLGVFSILGAVLNWQIDLMFITGVLAILGFSDNNIVVIFDKIRENLKLGVSPDFGVVVNNSVIETMSRSLNTNLTALFPVIALLLMVGASIQNLLVVLLIGIVVGTYDSICIAPMLLVVWQKREWGRFIGRGRPKAANART